MHTADTDRPDGLLLWQWSLYANGHFDRRNLAVHALTQPLFVVGTCALVRSALGPWWLALAGAGMMGVAMAAQGRGHRLESTPPVAFRGPLDVLARIFAEQWITFPRYVFSGSFARAWRRGQISRGAAT